MKWFHDQGESMELQGEWKDIFKCVNIAEMPRKHPRLTSAVCIPELVSHKGIIITSVR